MNERAQWVAELLGVICGVVGGVILLAARWGTAGAGWALILWSVALIYLGNRVRKGGR
ncbi:hypothetical protein ACH4OX_24345 [Streptomyces roseolus]|uniref:hypothetical protein n=1 Tax=Streptomyces roseolus TaxID=67358 RepID=UPI0037AB6AD6